MREFVRKHQTAFLAALLVLVGMIAFWRSVSFDFVNWDDPIYVQENPLIRSWSAANLKAVFTEVMAKNYAPLTTLSFMVDYSLWGDNPCGYHATNVVLHLANGVLVYLLILQLSRQQFVAFFTAALFLVHPVQIESVVWISSRKGLLCSMFMLLACLVRLKPESEPKHDGRYFLMLALALFCKAHAIVLPAIVLLYDVLIRNEKRSLAITRQFIPGLMSLALLLVTMSAQNSQIGGVRKHMGLSLPEIAAVDVTILWKYAGMLLAPTRLCVMYDPPTSGIWKQVLMGSIGWLGVGMAVWKVRKTHPAWLLGSLSILLLLFPMLNFFRITTLMNDRYLYLPCIIVFAGAMTGLHRLLQLTSDSMNGIVSALSTGVQSSLASVAVVACITLTHQHLPVWTNSQTLWAHASTRSPSLPVVRIQSALTAHGSGQVREAVRQLRVALLETQPDELDRQRIDAFIEDWTKQLPTHRTALFKADRDTNAESSKMPSDAGAEKSDAPQSADTAGSDTVEPFLSSTK